MVKILWRFQFVGSLRLRSPGPHSAEPPLKDLLWGSRTGWLSAEILYLKDFSTSKSKPCQALFGTHLELCVLLLSCVAFREVWALLPPPRDRWASYRGWRRLLAMWQHVAQQPRLPGVKAGLLLFVSLLSSLLQLESSIKQLLQLELRQCEHFGWKVFVGENVSKRHFYETLFLLLSLSSLLWSGTESSSGLLSF